MTDLTCGSFRSSRSPGFLVNGLLGRKFQKRVVTTVALVASLIPLLQVAVIVTKFGSLALPHIENLGPWIQAGSFHADFSSSLIS